MSISPMNFFHFRNMKNLIILLILSAAFVTSCVPPARFKALQSDNLSCQQERDQLRADNEKLSVENKETRSQLDVAQKSLARAEKDTLKWKGEVARLNRQYAQLNNDYNDLQEAKQSLMKGSETEINRLMNELQESQKSLQKREADLDKLSVDITTRKGELDKMQGELDQRNTRLSELEGKLQQQEEVLTSLRKKVSDALLGFENQGLTITKKNGKVYVSLDEKLLFKSGSTTVDPKGITALKKLATVLEQNPDINIMIEGHTDDVPVMNGSVYKDNWDLSVLRATSIVRILIDGTTINPARITTAGRSQFVPIDPAKTAEARQKNRRTEIILSPKLDELYNLVDQK
jgi:chemotaxis protein MotB